MKLLLCNNKVGHIPILRSVSFAVGLHRHVFFSLLAALAISVSKQASLPAKQMVMEDGAPSLHKHGAGLRISNTLTKRKDLFETSDGSYRITWYICGPTVYDTSHVGHARTYLSFDIIRRVLEDYFGYSVFYVMNITDVDDKIIHRARRNYLLEQYRTTESDPAKVVEQLEQAFSAEIAQQTKTVADADADIQNATSRQKEDLEERRKHELLKLAKLNAAYQAYQNRKTAAVSVGSKESIDLLLADGAADAVASQLDRAVGANVTDPAIYRAHAAKYEKEFFEDMSSLGVRPPDILTRVTEYVPEIIAYIKQILSRGFAYVANGSVYFDTTSFEMAGHKYGKLNPGAVGNAKLASESEQNFETIEKRSKCDFALWKASKTGEPLWDSPWGPGRPGWHIECSAMACDVIGKTIDIHSGGLDLQFPHHTNEIAQAEAYYCSNEWVKYFLHSGHLAIDGLKMSKSLKNFITIREALSKYTARQLRFLFIIQAWDKPMNFSDSVLIEVLNKERQLKTFFAIIAIIIRQDVDGAEKWEEEEKGLYHFYQEAEQQVRQHLEDSFDTSGALTAIFDLISATHLYIEKVERKPRRLLLMKVATFVTRILFVFGLSDARGGEIGFGRSNHVESLVAPYIDAFSTFRELIRGAARAGNSKKSILELASNAPDFNVLDLAPSDHLKVGPYVDVLAKFKRDIKAAAAAVEDQVLKETILEITGRVRDDSLAELGVRLEDTFFGPIWFFDDIKVLRAERVEKLELKCKRLEDKRDKLRKEFEKWQAASLKPHDLSKDYKGLDSNGVPTHDASGKDLSKQARKRLERDLKNFRERHEKFNLKVACEPQFMSKMEEEILELDKSICELRRV